jgi:1L-myo-inositol 1-phosphate cytidylyltransferase / CDP-L-myo-inositol myo-inositolphosphotransferase
MAGRAAEEFAATRPLIVPASRTRVGVVLAAGGSERLAGLTRNGSKALIRLGGLTLVERAVRGLLACGIEDVVVVVGHQADGVTAIVDAIAPGRVRAVHAEGWEEGNGASLAVAEPYVADEELFALVTVDHLFGAGSLEALLSAGGAAVLVDERPLPQAWGEGTRVVVEGGRAIAFGKQLDAPTIDCGAFLLPAEIFRHQRLAAGSGDASLAAAVTSFAGSQRLQAVPLPTGTWWHDVDTREDVRIAQRMLRRSLVKPTDGPVSRLLNRPISTPLSVALAALRPSPDLVSVLALLLGIVAAGALAVGWGIVGGVLVHVASIVDGMDGELARLQLRERPLGAFLDGIADRLADAAILAGVGVWALDRADGPLVVWLTVAAVTGSLLSMASKDRIAALGLSRPVERGPGHALGGRDGRLLLITIGAIAGQPALTLIAVALVSATSLALRALAVARRTT